jgi:hypothetical protein
MLMYISNSAHELREFTDFSKREVKLAFRYLMFAG